MASHDLLPCIWPNCGGEGFVEVDDEDFGIARGACQKCGACGPYVNLDDFRTVKAASEEAARLWNTRVAETELREALEEADVLLDELIAKPKSQHFYGMGGVLVGKLRTISLTMKSALSKAVPS